LATLAGRLLYDNGIQVNRVVAFSSPRVGDKKFSETYPVPLMRIEHKFDVVPHLPLSPRLAKFVGETLVQKLISSIDYWLDGHAENAVAGKIEYIHAGDLFYDDGDDVLFRIKHGSYIDKVLELALARMEILFDGEEPDND
jgi:Lipase (class 3)